ncbi:hypothetical protein J2X69_003465 [Algoriphagus sp. 4150]|nr:hypothetical protein [Algoriphagus sp. 4150]
MVIRNDANSLVFFGLMARRPTTDDRSDMKTRVLANSIALLSSYK